MKKAFDQTVRDLKREVNKKVLKVPRIEQKVLDATSNEPWGPHGSLLAEIAQATRNYYEYQMIMAIIWKRINDTGKNWRHVYKALLVLEYLVGHGSERVIDEIREHAYQISTLSDFQYIDSSGRDQGNNVRKKSQSLVVLVNDKERITEVRQKAAANREKFRSTSAGGMYRPGSYGDRYDDERYGSRDEDRYGREGSYRDDDRYGRYGDSYGDRYGRDYDERSSRDDDYRGRSRSIDDYGPRSRSADRYDDDGQSSSRGNGARADDQSQEGRRLERKYSEQNIGAPPSYEDATSETRSPAHSERNGETPAASVPGASPPPVPKAAASPPVTKAMSPPAIDNPSQATTTLGTVETFAGHGNEVAGEFDPRGPVSAAPTAVVAPVVDPALNTSKNVELDLLGSLVDSFTPNPLAIMPAPSSTTTTEADAQGFEDPFGDTPFKAIPSTDNVSPQPQTSVASVQPTVNQHAALPQAAVPKADTTVNNYGFGDTFSGMTHAAPNGQPPSTTSQFSVQEGETDILAGILPPSVPSPAVAPQGDISVTSFQPAQSSAGTYGNFNPQAESIASVASNIGPQTPQFGSGNFLQQGGLTAPMPSTIAPQTPAGPARQFNNGNFMQQGSASPVMSQGAHYAAAGPVPEVNNGNFPQHQGSGAAVASNHSNNVLDNMFSLGPNTSVASQPTISTSAGPLAIVPQPQKEKFETKSTVWADTLSRGLVNLNISGSKVNPLADIGVDFDAINRKERRMEKQTATPVTSTVTMGKAMGSGSGIGRVGAGALRPPPSPMMGSSMGIGGGGGMNMGMGMNSSPMGYGGLNQPMGRGMGMGMGQGGPMQAPTGFPPGSTMSGGYNPMMGSSGYNLQQPYGSGYR